jgi:hypothetical protein
VPLDLAEGFLRSLGILKYDSSPILESLAGTIKLSGMPWRIGCWIALKRTVCWHTGLMVLYTVRDLGLLPMDGRIASATRRHAE